MENYMVYGLYLFLIGMVGFLSYNGHILSMLLMMEFMVLGILLILSIQMSTQYLGSILLLVSFYLVCESILGISCVVLISRAHGNEHLISFSLVQC